MDYDKRGCVPQPLGVILISMVSSNWGNGKGDVSPLSQVVVTWLEPSLGWSSEIKDVPGLAVGIRDVGAARPEPSLGWPAKTWMASGP